MGKDLIFTYLKITIGLTIFSVAFTCFMLPYGLVTGGVSGISAFIYYATGFHASVSYFIINGINTLCVKSIHKLRYLFCIFTGNMIKKSFKVA